MRGGDRAGSAATPSPFAFAHEIRAVLFDAGNTLLWIDHARIAAILRSVGIACDAAAARAAEFAARPRLDPFLRTAARREGGAVVRRYAELIVEGVLPGRPPSSAAIDALAAAWLDLWCVPPDDAAPVLDALSARGHRVGCVSNSDGRVGLRLAAASLAHRLACIVDSGAVGIEKPDPRIFHLAAERLSVPPSACVYVGDFLALDVEGARAAGMHGVLLDPGGAWTAATTAAATATARAAPAADPAATSAPAPARPAHLVLPTDVAVVRSLTELAARLPAERASSAG